VADREACVSSKVGLDRWIETVYPRLTADLAAKLGKVRRAKPALKIPSA
jgi:hypothetical protein